MSAEQKWQLLNLGQVFLGLGAPAIATWLVARRSPTRLSLEVFLITLSVHILSYMVHMMWLHPLSLLHAAERSDTDYDGVGGNAAMLLVGWVPPLAACLLMAWWVGKRKHGPSSLC